MKKNVWIAPIVLIPALISSSCDAQQKAIAPVTTPVAQEPVIAVEPLKKMISITDASNTYQNPDKVKVITKRYGYKLKINYEVYRLDKFSKMYYKNCALTKLFTADKYEDYPKPMCKGVSGYVTFKDGAVIITVFNRPTYDNLVAQVKATGFTLDTPGSKDIYTNDSRTIACYKDGKSMRIQ